MTRPGKTLWYTVEGKRCFLVPEGYMFPLGPLQVRNLLAKTVSVDEHALALFEVTEDQACQWAKEELGEALEDIRFSIMEKLYDWQERLDEKKRSPVSDKTPATPNAFSDFFELLKSFPGVLSKSLSRDESRIGEARDTMADLQRRFKDSGIDLDERFTNFPERLADLRREVEQERADKRATKHGSPPDKS